ncbi:chromosomal protein D1 [Lucilia sericata]|uniref:chromosomal protein D1 n=1 Tax=Lucilia sericata TaxID=13632 RepID=UPI0018A81CF0|nr:chromosomal protein D1 [Lucilia sericata]XP_037828456.1 chromosomal protein D1 [Lucilia sericata]XP_037828457.1 chromosomal protein D1 [Lucilia sericata]
MNDKAEGVVALSDEGDCDGTVSPTPATVPKKRGRPSNAEKLKKVPSGRGRGRPAKGAEAANKKPVKAAVSADGSEEEGTASDGGSPLPNGDAVADASPGRGRQPKGKRKLTHTIEATGKGRGRPKKNPKPEVADDADEAADDNEDGASSDYKPGKKGTTKAAKKGRGRPKKVQNSDDESSDDKMEDEEEKRPVGRPSSGGVNLNIAHSGRGKGRPKKEVAKRRVAEAENGGGETTKKRGRPATSSAKPYVPTGKPRGRPKMAVQGKGSQDDENDDDDENPSEKVAENSADDDEDDEKMKSDDEDAN